MNIDLPELYKAREAMLEEAKNWEVVDGPNYSAALRRGRLCCSRHDKKTREAAHSYIQLRVLAEGLRRIGIHTDPF